jgi:stress response protein SCP2
VNCCELDLLAAERSLSACDTTPGTKPSCRRVRRRVKVKAQRGMEDIPIDSAVALRVGLSWDFFDGCVKTDLDCAALAFNSASTFEDACFFNQLEILDGSIKHSGDERDGTKEGFDEVILIDLARLPKDIEVIVLMVTAYQGGTMAGLCQMQRKCHNTKWCKL